MKPTDTKPMSREEYLLGQVKSQLLHEDDDKFPVPSQKAPPAKNPPQGQPPQ